MTTQVPPELSPEQQAIAERVQGLVLLTPASPDPDRVAEYRAAATRLGLEHLGPSVALLHSIDPDLAADGTAVGAFTVLAAQLGLHALEDESAEQQSRDLAAVLGACLERHGIVPGKLEALLERAAVILETVQDTGSPGRQLAGEIRRALAP